MKKLIMLLAAIVISSGTFAQESKSYDSKTQETTKAKTSQQQDTKVKDNITMRGEKVWLTRDGKTIELDKELKLENGATVSTMGLITYKDGTTRQLKSGEIADMKGNITVTATPEKKDEKMEMEK